MTPPKAIIADDEEPLRNYLKVRLNAVWPELVICGEAENGERALALAERFKPDIAFLDIKMPGLSGMEVAQKISSYCRIVFITAFDQYAVEAFEKEAADYLLKPVTRRRLAKTVGRLKLKMKTETERPPDLSRMLNQLMASHQAPAALEYLQWIKARHGGSIRLIPTDDADYFMAQDKYTVVQTASDEFLIKTSIKELAGLLDPAKFWRIHRGTIVNASRIAQVSRSVTGRGVLKLKNGRDTLTISRRYLSLFKQM
jgi:DNA-binding LytR/AlgR family response regulator